jgi:hypothetical protein
MKHADDDVPATIAPAPDSTELARRAQAARIAAAGWYPSLDPESYASTQREHVARWNDAHPVGTPVRYWTGDREGDGKTSVTRTVADLLDGHTAVVCVEGVASCIALSHVEAVA